MVRSRDARDLRRLAPAALAAALAALYLIWQPPSLDLAAAEYRAWLFGHAGFTLWNAQWYGGHHVPAYSLVFPPLAAWLGPRLLGALAVAAAAVLFERLAHHRYGGRAWLGATWFAAGAAANLFSGRITFVLGLPLALAALLALQRKRRTLALAFALLTALASPVDALFLALAAVALALGERRARAIGLGLAAAAMAPVLVLALLFPEGGVEPFGFTSLWPVLVFAPVALLLVLPGEERALRIGAALYLLGCLAAFALDTPVGSNVVRLGPLAAGPVAALVLWPRRALLLALLTPFLLWWQWTPPISDVAVTIDDPSVHAAYYAPLLAELGRLGATGAAGRLEIPFTRAHWEARWVAPAIPLARGWERQLDVGRNGVFYTDGGRGAAPLTATGYHAWLRANAVRWVALPDVPLDYSAQPEARLIRRGLPYLRPVWRGAHWQLYAVAGAAPLAEPPARVLHAGTDSLTVRVPRAGGQPIRLRIRWSPYWDVLRGDACLAPDAGYAELRARGSGTVELGIRFSPARIAAQTARCEDPSGVGAGQPR